MTLYEQMMQNKPAPQANPNAVASVKRMMNTLKGVSNPAQAMQMLSNQNPQINSLMTLANGSGGAKNLFYQKAKEMGVNPDSILNQLK